MLASVHEIMGAEARTFTAGQAREWMMREHGVTLSVGRIRAHLLHARLSCQRTCRDLRHNQKPEETARARATLIMAANSLKRGIRVLFSSAVEPAGALGAPVTAGAVLPIRQAAATGQLEPCEVIA